MHEGAVEIGGRRGDGFTTSIILYSFVPFSFQLLIVALLRNVQRFVWNYDSMWEI